jgi:peroxiredoxin
MIRSIVTVSFALFAGSALAVTAGTAAPDFAVADSKGRTVKLSDYKGRFVVLEWTNPECPFVRAQYGADAMQALQKEAGAKDVVWLAVNSTNKSSS